MTFQELENSPDLAIQTFKEKKKMNKRLLVINGEKRVRHITLAMNSQNNFIMECKRPNTKMLLNPIFTVNS